MATSAEIYRATKKTPDFLWNLYVCRPLAAVVVRLVDRWSITPNQITLISMVVAAASIAMLLVLPGYRGLVIAIVVYELSYVLDCADGMLARWRRTQSPAGHHLDFLMDEIKAFGMLGAAAVRLYFERTDVRLLFVGLFGLVCLASGIALTTFLRRPEIAGTEQAVAQSATARKSPVRRLIGLVESAARFAIHYPSYILFTAIAGHLELYFFPYVAVNALYAVRAFTSVALRFGRG